MTRDVVAVPEKAVRLRVNGLRIATWTCTPHALEALAAGRLVHDGFITSADDVLALRTLPPEDGILGVDAEVPPGRMAVAVAEAEHRDEHGCGPRFLLDCRPDLIRRAPAAPPPDPAAFHGLFRALYDGAATYRGTGGLHTAALSDGASLSFLHEEVGRHNAVDKAIGHALLEGADRPALGLVTTARISGDIAAKAARAGLAWIASRSVPTTLAVEIAAVAGIGIVARAPSPDARVFAPGDSVSEAR
ncbi:MAG: formate dehydrogenase accessory sulfurtransferase FdhD [Gemmatimonadetes bacterium]|nr:formate dehydrogenase accessory sulfurtransferase FdhD [Gemmatimonadota bacterium]